jgi:hypothetical protein
MSTAILSVTIPAGQALSGGLECGVGHIVRIGAPSDWTAAPLSFQMAMLPVYDAPPADAEYLDVFHVVQATSGTWTSYEVSLSVTAGSALLMPSSFGFSLGWIRLRSGTRSQPIKQSADRTFALMFG